MAAPAFKDDLVTRREAIRRVSALLGGVALVGQSAWLAGCATAQRVAASLFSESDVVLLDEIADTILPATKTPGAKAAGVGPFIAMMVTDTYDPGEQRMFRDGLETLERESRAQNGGGFMASSPAQRVALLERLDREAIEYMRMPGNADRPHYFRHDQGADAARLLHVGDRLHAGHALRRDAGPVRSVHHVHGRRQGLGAARLISPAA